MGNSNGSFSNEQDTDLWWKNANGRDENVSTSRETSDKPIAQPATATELAKDAQRKHKENVSKEISSLHEKRLKIIAEKKKEFDRLRQDLVAEKLENEKLRTLLKSKGIEMPSTSANANENEQSLTRLDRNTLDYLKITRLTAENDELKTRVHELEMSSAQIENASSEENRRLKLEIANLQTELQTVNAELVAFERERQEYNTHVTALKDIIKVSKQLLEIRQNQITQLNTKLEQIQNEAAEKEMKAYADDLRQEYEKQLKNIKDLRTLYEERQAAAEAAKERYKKELEDTKKQLEQEKTKNSEHEERIQDLEKDNSEKYDKIANLELSVNIKRAECNELQVQLTVINQLFSEIILGFRNGHEIDMDKLIDILEENHDLLTDIVVNEESTEVSSTLPKVLLDLINQVKESETKSKNTEEKLEPDRAGEQQEVASEETKGNPSNPTMNSAAEIVQNLPKVWKVLAELLSHQQIPVNNISNDQSGEDPCYKSIQTPTGPRLVLSVSGTFIRLKDLILEKKSLEKETFHLKQLNTHLESRLQDQEKRLEMVCSELSKTWHVVGKMQKQHHHLHTQEKILRYELAQKRQLLTQLKEELEYCREKWMKAREKNNKTELEWKELRDEFASRKNNPNDDLNNSVESGFSDERDLSSDEEVYESDTPVSPAAINDEGETESPIHRSEDSTVDEVQMEQFLPEVNSSILEVVEEEIANIERYSLPKSETVFSPEKDLDLGNSSIDKEQEVHSIGNVTEKADDSVQVGLNECSDSSCLCKAGASSSTDLPKRELHARKAEIVETYKRLENDILLTVAKAQKGNSSNVATRTAEVLQSEDLKREDIKLFPTFLHEVPLAQPQRGELIEEESSTIVESSAEAEDVAVPSTSTATNDREGLTPSEILARREERLRLMEEQCKQLTFKILSNSYRGCQMYRKLSDLHERHGSTSSTNEPTSDSSDNDDE